MIKTLKDYFIVLFGSGIGRGIAFVNSAIIARWLGVEAFGMFSLFYVVMIIIWQFPQSFDVTYVRYAKTSGCHMEKKEFLKVAVFLKLVYSVIMLFLSYPLTIFLANLCFHKPQIQVFLVYSVICGVFLSFLFTVASIFQEKEKFIEYSILNTFYTLSVLLACVLFIYFNKKLSLNIVIVIYLATTVSIGSFCIWMLFKRIGWVFPLNRKVFNQSFSLGKWIFGVTTLYFIFQRVDVLFLARYVDFKAIGLYSAAVQIIMAITLMTGALNGVSLPKASCSVKSKESLRKYVKESIVTTFLINLVIIMLIVFSPFCIKIVFGSTYVSVAPVLRILLLGWIFAVFYVPFSSLFYAMNDSRTRFLLECTKVIIGILLLNIMIPWKGVTGAAVAVSITLFLDMFISLSVLKRRINRFMSLT